MTNVVTINTVVGIHIAPATRLAITSLNSVVAETGAGLVGDRYHASRRSVTVQSAEQLAAAAGELGHPIDPASTRRNITVLHGEIPLRKGSRIILGAVELKVVRYATPCALLDDWIAPGAMLALRRRSGAICTVAKGGAINLGAPVKLLPRPE